MENQDTKDHIGESYNQVYSLDYGGFDSKSLSEDMPEDTCYSIGFNDTYGLVDVIDDKHKPYFEGRIDITSLLKELKFEDIKDKKPSSKEIKKISPYIEKEIMNAYDNWFYSENNPEEEVISPILEVLTYEGKPYEPLN